MRSHLGRRHNLSKFMLVEALGLCMKSPVHSYFKVCKIDFKSCYVPKSDLLVVEHSGEGRGRERRGERWGEVCVPQQQGSVIIRGQMDC